MPTLKEQINEGRILRPNGSYHILSQNERLRYQALFSGGEIPAKEKTERRSPIVSQKVASEKVDVIGVGNELHDLLAAIGINESSGCGCKEKSRQMNSRGIAWCEQHRDELAQWMVNKSESRLKENKSKLLWLPESVRSLGERIVAGSLIDRAIENARLRLRQRITGKKIAVGITTAPRGGERLLPRCVRSVFSAGFDDVSVFAEPGSSLDGSEPAKVIQRAVRLGAWHNWMKTLEDMLDGDADYLLIVQDDCILSCGTRDFCDAIAWPSYDCAAIQLCCSRYYEDLPNGVSKMPGTGMVGAWATLMHRFYAQQILSYGVISGWRGHHSRTETDPVKMKAIDDYIGYASRQLGYSCAIIRPSIVLHDADISTLGHGDSKGKNNRKTIDWIGENGVALDCVPIAKESVTFQT